MAPELEKDLIIGVVSALSTALFAGVPGIALFWWTYRRDQERLIVQKLLYRLDTLSGGKIFEKDQFGPTFGILIRNRSLFSVHVSAVGFEIDGEVIALERALYPVKTKVNPDPNSYMPFVPDGDPQEIPSQASMTVSVRDTDRPKIAVALLKAAEKHGVSIEDILMGPKFAALVATETGKQFTSISLLARAKRLFGKALLAPE